jgi:hypothetical protein
MGYRKWWCVGISPTHSCLIWYGVNKAPWPHVPIQLARNPDQPAVLIHIEVLACPPVRGVDQQQLVVASLSCPTLDDLPHSVL